MNGPQDVGGAHGFGPVVPEPNEPVFHDDWETLAFALSILMGPCGFWSIDRSRYFRETLPHPDYYTLTYYGIWLEALERLVADVGIHERTPPPKRVLRGAEVRPTLAAGFPYDRPGPAPRFGVGAAVRVRPMNPAHHNRAPRYLRGKTGWVTRVHGIHVFPDTSAQNAGEAPTALYTIAFDAKDLWGEDTTAGRVHADLFEPYLDAV
ncbi:MAG: nitrile hydratase subunit beta [Pseudomonadota bacterium]